MVQAKVLQQHSVQAEVQQLPLIQVEQQRLIHHKAQQLHLVPQKQQHQVHHQQLIQVWIQQPHLTQLLPQQAQYRR